MSWNLGSSAATRGNTASKRPERRGFRPQLDRLEDRELKDGAISMVAGTIQIHANGPKDAALVFYVDKAHTLVGVVLDGNLAAFSKSQVNGINFTGGNGANTFGNLTDIADTATGGNGVNTFVGGAGDNTFTGGNGTNVFIASASTGDNVMTGGSGTNVMMGGTGRNMFNGGTGNNFIWANTGVNLIVNNGGHDWAIMDSTTTIQHNTPQSNARPR
jgi:Ca2+-binding RTX toxin-like protein